MLHTRVQDGYRALEPGADPGCLLRCALRPRGPGCSGTVSRSGVELPRIGSLIGARLPRIVPSLFVVAGWSGYAKRGGYRAVTRLTRTQRRLAGRGWYEP
jgi:hypothetical protein